MSDIRSTKCVFVSHCMLAQAVMAEGLVKHHPSAVKPVFQFCLDNDINIIQMQCPETLTAAGGLGRSPKGKKWYEANGLRETAQELAKSQADYMEALLSQGFDVLGVIGIEFSPACAVDFLNEGRRITRNQGIFIEELKSELEERSIDVPFIGVTPRWHRKMAAQLEGLLA